MRFGRNLTASEILDQALHFRRKEPVNHAVFMGMGEPLMNLDNVLAACAYSRHRDRAPNIGVSTVGWIPGSTGWPRRAAGPPGAVAPRGGRGASLELMPVNDRYPLRDVLDACLRWHERRHPVFVEYLMLDGVNDRYEQAVALARCSSRGVPRSASFPTTRPLRLQRLRPRRDRGVPGRPREARRPDHRAAHRGRDIAAACGQLAARRQPGAAEDQHEPDGRGEREALVEQDDAVEDREDRARCSRRRRA